MNKLFLSIALLFCISANAQQYSNPVVNYSLPDPTVIKADDGYYYLYATENIRNLPIHRSKDLVNWTMVGTAFTNEIRPTFEPKGNLWAPDINKIGNKYIMYYSMSVWGGEWTCGIGVAEADKPEGPFTDKGKLFRSNEIGIQNCIDPFYIEDGGKKYLFWGSFHGIYGAELTDDGLALKKDSRPVQVAGDAYEGTYIHKRDGYYYLFASIGRCCEGLNSTYTTVVGRSKNLFGPYVDKKGKPMMENHHEILIQKNEAFVGPGHNSEIVTDDAGNDWMFYHAVSVANPEGRVLMLDRVDWQKGWPSVAGAAPSLKADAPSIAKEEATAALDAFNAAFYNPEMKLYAISSDLKGRAAIWVQAIYWDMVMNAYKRTKSPEYRRLMEDIYQGGYEQYDKYNWDNKIEWFIYDDMMWWIISLARAYEITGEPKYLAHASSGFYHVWKESYDKERGGMWWNFKHDGKMSCINYPTVVGAMTLYNITHDPDYLEKAKEIYAWSLNVFFDKKDGRVADNMHYHFQRQNSMDIDWTTQLYNQATFIGSAVMLYKATGEESYLKEAILAADHVRNEMCDADGLLPFKNGIEQGIYAAIFAQYIIRLIEDGNQPQYMEWLRHNIDTAWQHRDKKRNLTFKNAAVPCPDGVMESYDASGCPALMQVISPLK